MKPRKLQANIYWIGAVDWDRRLFDELIPLPDGTSYNAYLVKGSEKTALIDTVDPPMANVLIDNLNQLDAKNIDFVVANHAEQDHSGTLPQILKRYPNAVVVATPKCKSLLMDLLLIPENKIITVEDRNSIIRRQNTRIYSRSLGSLAGDDAHISKRRQNTLSLRFVWFSSRNI